MDSKRIWEEHSSWIILHDYELPWSTVYRVADFVKIDGEGPFPLESEKSFILIFDNSGEAIAFRFGDL